VNRRRNENGIRYEDHGPAENLLDVQAYEERILRLRLLRQFRESSRPPGLVRQVEVAAGGVGNALDVPLHHVSRPPRQTIVAIAAAQRMAERVFLDMSSPSKNLLKTVIELFSAYADALICGVLHSTIIK